jgi:hypothetical protein
MSKFFISANVIQIGVGRLLTEKLDTKNETKNKKLWNREI